MQRLFVFLSLALCLSCQKQIKAKFTLTNGLTYNLDSVHIRSALHNQVTEFIKLKPGETKTYYLDMTYLPKAEGSYLLSYKTAPLGGVKAHRFGYYTNGAPVENNISLCVQPDILVCEYEHGFY